MQKQHVFSFADGREIQTAVRFSDKGQVSEQLLLLLPADFRKIRPIEFKGALTFAAERRDVKGRQRSLLLLVFHLILHLVQLPVLPFVFPLVLLFVLQLARLALRRHFRSP